MLTLKFIKSSSYEETVVEAARCDKQTEYFENSTEKKSVRIIIYPQLTSDSGGVEFHIGGDHPLAYRVCFIENSAGKTIDRIGPFESDEKRKPMPIRTNTPQLINSKGGKG